MSKSVFIPGDEWLYYKIYCGVKTTNLLLIEVIEPLIEHLKAVNFIENWFFVRFSDPDPHLRLRLKAKNQNYIGMIIQYFCKELKVYVVDGVIWRIELDSYVRELERYGNDTIIFAEKIFCADSELVLRLLKIGNSHEVHLWGVLRSVENFLDLFEFDKEGKKKFYEIGASSFNREFYVHNKYLSTLRRICIEKNLISLHSKKEKLGEDYELVLAAINDRDDVSKVVAKKLVQLDNAHELHVPLLKFIQSCIHMFYNKAFDSFQRRLELIGYNLRSNNLI